MKDTPKEDNLSAKEQRVESQVCPLSRRFHCTDVTIDFVFLLDREKWLSMNSEIVSRRGKFIPTDVSIEGNRVFTVRRSIVRSSISKLPLTSKHIPLFHYMQYHS